MRTLVFIDPSYTEDETYYDYLKEELPRRLQLLSDEYAATEWVTTFADDEYGDDSLAAFSKTVDLYHATADAVVLVPNQSSIESDHGIRSKDVLRDDGLRLIQQLVKTASEHEIPVIAYLDEADTKSDFNLTTAGVTHTVDNVADPALLALKVAMTVNKNADTSGQLKIGAFSIDVKTGEVNMNEKPVHLTGSEKGLLLSLARHRGTVRTKASVMSDLYQFSDEEPDEKIVDVFTTKLRRKLNDASPGFGFDIIRTSWGDGYVMPVGIPNDRIYFGLLRLDPQENGRYQIANTTHSIGHEELELLQFLYESQGKPEDLDSNYMRANTDYLAQLERTLSSYLVAYGSPIDIDQEEGTVRLNVTYFDPEHFTAHDFSTLLRQDIRVAGEHKFLKQSSGPHFILQGTEVAFNRAEVSLLEQLASMPRQAIRAGVVYSNVRGSGYQLRGSVSPEEDIIRLGREVYKKLEAAGRAVAAENQVHFYHDEFLSLGPAEEVPDLEALARDRKERLTAHVKDSLETAGDGYNVLEPLDLGYFRIMVHPTLGEAIVEDHAVKLNTDQVKIVRAIFDKRPEYITKRELHEAVFPNRPFTEQLIPNRVGFIRSLFADVDPESVKLLHMARGKGYRAFLPDEEIPMPEKKVTAPRSTSQAAVVLQPAELEGGLTIQKNLEKGTCIVEGTNMQLNKNQTAFLEFMSENYTRTVYESELQRELGVKGIKALAQGIDDMFTPVTHKSPIERSSSGFRWSGIPHPEVEAANGNQKVFEFQANGDFMCRCDNHGLDFTVREAEILDIIDDRKGQTLDGEAIRAAALKFSWPDNVILQTMQQVHGKLADTDTVHRIRLETKRGNSIQLTMH